MSFTIRRLHGIDFANGFPGVLEALAPVGLSKDKAEEIFAKHSEHATNIFVAIEGKLIGPVIGTATLLMDMKYIHGGSLVGHIEDVAVAPSHQGRGVGRALIEALLEEAKLCGCYKVILNCDPAVRPFYEKLGFYVCEYQMRYDVKVPEGPEGWQEG